MKLSKPWQIVASVGHGVMVGLAMAGLIRISGLLTGTPVSSELAGNVFLITSLIVAPITGYLNTAAMMMPAVAAPKSE